MKSFRSAPQPSNAPPEKIVRLFQSETAEILEAPEPLKMRVTMYLLAALIVALGVLSVVTRLDRVIMSTGGGVYRPLASSASARAIWASWFAI